MNELNFKKLLAENFVEHVETKNNCEIEQWVSQVISFSTQYRGWEAKNIIGPSNTYPKYGDITTAWYFFMIYK